MSVLPTDLFFGALPAMQTLLKELVNIESPSDDKIAVDRLGQRIREELVTLGGEIKIFPQEQTGDHFACRWGNGEGGLLVMMHMDTVFDLGTLARQPFRLEDGMIFGPGVIDMKCSIAMLLTILRLCQEQGTWPARSITALFTSDEETGSLTSRALIERMAKQAVAVFCLEPATASGALKTARKGTGDIQITARGVAAHAGIDYLKGRNAIEELAFHILDAQKQTDIQQGTTVNVGVVSGGTRGNVVPDEAHALIDLRITQMDEYARLERWVNGLKPVIQGTTLSADITLNRPPMPRDETMIQTYQKAQSIAQMLGMQLTEGSTGGGSDANFVAPLGIPVLDGLGGVGDGAHSEREYVRSDSLAERSALLAALLLNW